MAVAVNVLITHWPGPLPPVVFRLSDTTLPTVQVTSWLKAPLRLSWWHCFDRKRLLGM
ncbi:MAG: hypothetical protein H8M99_07015 [Gloeobacteraceae cyanobacterium ES-bin-144]|nr:hypothetical protein [Verrucomicrobiales bacterium]